MEYAELVRQAMNPGWSEQLLLLLSGHPWGQFISIVLLLLGIGGLIVGGGELLNGRTTTRQNVRFSILGILGVGMFVAGFTGMVNNKTGAGTLYPATHELARFADNCLEDKLTVADASEGAVSVRCVTEQTEALGQSITNFNEHTTRLKVVKKLDEIVQGSQQARLTFVAE